jgi:hypothetical protein
MLTGRPVAQPDRWENELGLRLLDDPEIPLLLEASRQPRPSIPPIPPPGDSWWSCIRNLALQTPDDDGPIIAPLGDIPLEHQLEGGQFDGWYWLAAHECRLFERPDFRNDAILQAERYRLPKLTKNGQIHG